MVGFADDPECKFAIVQATIESVDGATVTFTARGVAFGSPDQILRKKFTVPLTEVLTSSIDGAPGPVAMAPGATGNLYLSRTGWLTRSSDGYSLFGADRAIFKWPLCAGIATPILTPLRVIPTSIVVRGHLEGQDALFDIELLGPEAATSQDVAWNCADLVALRLAPDGARRLQGASAEVTVRMWPTQIIVKGAPEIDPTISGEVDILNAELAGEHQRITFPAPGAPVTLLLTQDGVAAFHVTPQLVAEIARVDSDACV
jgi:hypothetical protein